MERAYIRKRRAVAHCRILQVPIAVSLTDLSAPPAISYFTGARNIRRHNYDMAGDEMLYVLNTSKDIQPVMEYPSNVTERASKETTVSNVGMWLDWYTSALSYDSDAPSMPDGIQYIFAWWTDTIGIARPYTRMRQYWEVMI